MSNSRNPNIVPTFLQPNTVRSSRAAIFHDNFDQQQQHSKPTHNNRLKSSRRNQDEDSQEEEDSEDGDDQQSKSILERLYGQLQGAIEIEDTEMTMQTSEAASNKRLYSDSDKSDVDEEGQDEDDGMEFRLFASDETPTTIVLNAKEPEIIYVHRERPPLDESPGSERMQQIAEAVIDAKTVLEQSHIPWARSFYPHKVIHIPFKQETGNTKVKKSKRKREWEKKVKAGLIDQATIDATTRKTKVSESWGQPYTPRHGLDRYTIDAGTQPKETYSSRGGRDGGRGGASRGGARGGRGGGRGRGGAGASTGTTRDGHPGKSDRHGDNKKKEVSIDRPTKKKSTTDSPVKKTQGEKVKSKSESTSAATTTTKTTTDAAKSVLPKKRTAGTESSTKTEISSNNSSTPAAAAAAVPRPPKKPKANKPMTKLDNIMAILTGK
ncbi:hypothetical protein KI688_012101 [Linnemannia hyalina]|uniref:Uncharacterized protein n=1 Tax=Linnemannia hyalina TaxID=64524 RepID=A0A9P7XW56_9FUNG|nr:hypothetical protein KI688_012101 [Linnemannia hyalina]